MSIDLSLWRKDVHEIEARIRELKGIRRESGQPRWTSTEGQAFRDARERATALYVVRAHARGRAHPLGERYAGRPAADFVADALARVLPRYAGAVSPEAA